MTVPVDNQILMMMMMVMKTTMTTMMIMMMTTTTTTSTMMRMRMRMRMMTTVIVIKDIEYFKNSCRTVGGTASTKGITVRVVVAVALSMRRRICGRGACVDGGSG